MVTTPNLDLNLPTVGANRDTWGALLNDNFTTLDQSVSMAMPIGAILDFAGPTPPPGWLACDGRLVSRVTYAALFAVISTYWGAGDGSTTFALPPCPGRASVGPGTVIDQAGNSVAFSFTLTSGFVFNSITQTYLPNYAMATDTQGYHAHSGASAPGGSHSHTTDAQGLHNHGTPGTDQQGSHTHTEDVQGNHSHTYQNSAIPAGSGLTLGPGVSYNEFTDTTSVAGAHSHNISTAGLHAHNINWDGSHTHTTNAVGDHWHGIYADGNHAHNVWMGGGGNQFPVLSPIICVTKIIYAGQEATTRVLTAAAAPTRRLSAPLRGSH